MICGRAWFYSLFVIALLTTEFFYIQVGGGVARLYHFWSVAVVLLLASSFPWLFYSRVFKAIVFFAVLNLLTALFSDDPDSALASLLSNFANLGIVVAIALVLLTGRLTIEQLAKIILVVTVVSVGWGVLQIIGGVGFALSPEQETQIQIGFGPGFRTEANTFGKYMSLPFLLFLPVFLHNQRNRMLQLAYVVMAAGILMNFTRTALYGIAVALLFAFAWYLVKGQIGKVTTRFFAIGAAALLFITLIQSGEIYISEYASHKIENFFSKEEVLEGGSSAYRLESMEAVLQNTLGSDKRMLIGNGWGQTYVEIRGQEVQAGGGDIINLLGYSGVAGILAYLLYTFLAFSAAFRLAWRRDSSPQTLFAEGVVFALVGMFVTGQISGYLIAPEYYLLLGICVYLSLVPRLQRPATVARRA